MNMFLGAVDMLHADQLQGEDASPSISERRLDVVWHAR